LAVRVSATFTGIKRKAEECGSKGRSLVQNASERKPGVERYGLAVRRRPGSEERRLGRAETAWL